MYSAYVYSKEGTVGPCKVVGTVHKQSGIESVQLHLYTGFFPSTLLNFPRHTNADEVR